MAALAAPDDSQVLTVRGGWPRLLAIIVVVLSLGGTMMARRLDRHFGLTGTYYAGSNWQHKSFTVVDKVISSESLRPRLFAFGPNPFSVTWRGFLAISQDRQYEFVTQSDDGSTVVVDGQIVVENGGVHGPQSRSGKIFLRAGFHPIELRYFQGAGGYALDWGWRSDNRPFVSLPRTALLQNTELSWPSYRLVVWLRHSMSFAPFVWTGLLVVWLLRRFAGSLWRFVGRPARSDGVALVLVLVAATALILPGLTWPADWAPDEVAPSAVLNGAAHWFSGGWYEKYPPLQYYILAAAYLPFTLFASFTNMEGDLYQTLMWVHRLVSAVMAVGTLLVIYALGREMRSPFAGILAAAQTAVLPMFVFYGKTANLDVPYLFWSMCALFFYLRAVRRGSHDHWRFALFATLAVCTKDQAYGLFVLPAAHLAINRAQQLRHHGASRWWRLALDPVLGLAVLVAVVVFVVCDNLLFNWAGFISHVRFLIFGSASYRVFPATAHGHMQMLLSSLSQLRWSFGRPLAGVVLVAVVATLLDRHARHRLWLLLPAASYYLFFVSVVLYNYDRFFLPVCILLAVLVGCWAEDLREKAQSRPARVGAAMAALAIAIYTCAYGASVDRMMLGDSRYFVENWLSANVPVDTRIGAVRALYPPLVSSFQMTRIDYDSLVGDPPRFVVVNSDVMARYGPNTELGRVYGVLMDGSRYEMVLSHKTRFLLAPLAEQTELVKGRELGLTNLDKINPTVQIFELVAAH